MPIKVHAVGPDREEVKRLSDVFRGRIIDVTDRSYTMELTGTGEKLDAFIHALDPGMVIEVVRSGASAISRGAKAI